MKILTFNN